MLPVLTAAEMRDADRRTIEGGVPAGTLMERAGAAVARAVRERFPHARRVAVLCGKGNNGGDGFVAARHLRDLDVRVLLCASRLEVTGDAAAHLSGLEHAGVVVHEVRDAAGWERVRADALQSDVVIDALLGTGLREAAAGLVGHVVADVSASVVVPVVAVDIASGLSSDSGTVPGPALRADVTVTFAAPKHGHVLPPACDRTGELVVADIGIAAGTPSLWLLEAADAARAYPPRRRDAHKGDFGHVLAVAGSQGKTGAAVLCATAALRAGAGLVTVATAERAQPLVAAARAELMTDGLPAAGEAALARCLALAERCDAAVLGPGWGASETARALAVDFFAACPAPLVCDADGLNALADASRPVWRPDRATVLTPHPGEMSRLLDVPTREVQADRLGAARSLAAESGAVVVLKGQRTIVAHPDGRAAVNPTGNPAMAKGGTGDALAGIVGALLARGCDAWGAATAGVFLHGRAGDLAAARTGPESLLAGDLVDALGEAIRSLRDARG
jgi:ADP-dependent NAD(P)H-hydrate dehydratase / NAD(P)H-hydrate epimerase